MHKKKKAKIATFHTAVYVKKEKYRKDAEEKNANTWVELMKAVKINGTKTCQRRCYSKPESMCQKHEHANMLEGAKKQSIGKLW